MLAARIVTLEGFPRLPTSFVAFCAARGPRGDNDPLPPTWVHVLTLWSASLALPLLLAVCGAALFFGIFPEAASDVQLQALPYGEV